jgi:TRAP transporter TAXI family solute receptor
MLLAAACGDGEGRVQFLSIGTAGTGGIYYPLGGAIASRLSVADSLRQYTAEVSGGSVENINRLAAGQMDLGIALAVSAYQAQRGEGDFTQAVTGLRAVAPLYPNLTHILVRANAPMQAVADLRGRRVSVGSPGSGTEQLARDVLQGQGLTYEDIQPRYLSFNESSAALRDGAIDAAIFSVGYPAAAVLEAATTGAIRLLPIDAETLARMVTEHPYYSPGVIPAGVYPGVDTDVSSLVVNNWLVGMESLDGSVVELVLAILRDDRASLVQVHEMARQIDLARLEAPPIPLHPAAEAWLEGR